MIGYWVFNKNNTPRNFAQSGYGKLQESGLKYFSAPMSLSEFYLTINSNLVSGEIYRHGDLSIGLIGVDGKCIPYLRYNNIFHKPDNRYTKENSVWGIEVKKEQFADKDYVVSFYSDDTNIYTNGSDDIKADGHIFFPLVNQDYDVKLFAEKTSESKFSNNWFNLFGATGSLSNSMPLWIGPLTYPAYNSFNISMGAVETCYLLDESGNVLYDEFGTGLLAEGCSSIIGFFNGFDMSISGNNSTHIDMPLYLQQTETTYSLTSGIPLYMEARTFLNSGINLSLANYYTNINSGVNLFIESPGDNDGYIPTTNSMPLFIQRGENGYMELFISGAAIGTSGQVNLTLQASQTPTGSGINLSLRYVHDITSSSVQLYTAGW